MTKNLMITLLCVAIFSCSKELPTNATNAIVPVPMPWKTSAVSTTPSGSSTAQGQADCSNLTANEKSSGQYCNNHHIGYPVTGCAGGGSDTGVYCCRLTPPVTPPER
jgi:hypothetical protein